MADQHLEVSVGSRRQHAARLALEGHARRCYDNQGEFACHDLLKLLGFVVGFVDGAHHVEGLLGQFVALAVDQLLESLDRILYLDVPSFQAGEDLRDEHGLGHEQLDLPGAGDDQLVVVRQLVDAQDGDDILEVLVPLQDLLHTAGDAVVALTDDGGSRIRELDSRGSTAGKMARAKRSRDKAVMASRWGKAVTIAGSV